MANNRDYSDKLERRNGAGSVSDVDLASGNASRTLRAPSEHRGRRKNDSEFPTFASVSGIGRCAAPGAPPALGEFKKLEQP